jgi:hypothetical protein
VSDLVPILSCTAVLVLAIVLVWWLASQDRGERARRATWQAPQQRSQLLHELEERMAQHPNLEDEVSRLLQQYPHPGAIEDYIEWDEGEGIYAERDWDAGGWDRDNVDWDVDDGDWDANGDLDDGDWDADPW